jgi:tRNA A-37 threonylcarbamoyl transferase component Bud32
MGRQLDRYRLVRHVGRGGSSDVFEAEHIHVGKRVALKLLRRELARDEHAVERLRREARTASAIGHRNIVNVEDFGVTADGTVYLAMEWLDGETLAQRIERGPVGLPATVDLALQIGAGLGAAHAAGVVHRDLKPANVFLVDDNGRDLVKLLDFGIAKSVRGDARLTGTGAFIGTADYVAPEQALGDEVDARADLYALGVVLYQLLTGSLPFRAGNFMAVLHRHATEPPEPPSVRAPDRDISPALEAVVLRCLAKDREARFAGADDFVAALTAAAGAPGRIAAAGVGPSARARRVGPSAPAEGFAPAWRLDPPVSESSSDSLAIEPPRRGRVGAWLALLVALGAAGGVGLAMMQRRESPTTAAGAAADAGAARMALADAAAPAPADAAAVAPADAAAPATSTPRPPAAWTLPGRAAGFDYTARVTPRRLRAGRPFQLEIEIRPGSSLAGSWRPGLVRAVLAVLHDRRVELRGEFPLDDAGRLSTRLTLPRNGVHQVELVLRGGGRELAGDSFALCVGADPAGDRAALERVCPSMPEISPPPPGR